MLFPKFLMFVAATASVLLTDVQTKTEYMMGEMCGQINFESSAKKFENYPEVNVYRTSIVCHAIPVK